MKQTKKDPIKKIKDLSDELGLHFLERVTDENCSPAQLMSILSSCTSRIIASLAILLDLKVKDLVDEFIDSVKLCEPLMGKNKNKDKPS